MRKISGIAGIVSFLLLLPSCGKINEKGLLHSFEDDLVDGIESCFTKEMNAQMNSIEAVRNDRCLVFNIVSDNHISSDPESVKSNKSTLRNLKYLSDHMKIDATVHLGDIVAQRLSDNDGLSDESIFSIMSDYLDKLGSTGPELFAINGNHDGPEGNLYDEALWLNLVSAYDGPFVERYADSPYFYVDYPAQNLRCVFLSLPDNYPSGTQYYGFNPRSIKWLKSEAFNVEDGTDIIIFGHIPTITASHMSAGHMVNLSSFTGMCHAFNSHGTFRDRLVSCDYSSYGSSKILAYVSGHLHTDLLVMPDYEYEGTRNMPGGKKEPFTYKATLPCPEIIIGHNYFYGDSKDSRSNCGGRNYSRERNHYSQDLWDTMVYDPDTKKLHFIRFGAGEDRVINPVQ